jgi:hypothetical protein
MAQQIADTTQLHPHGTYSLTRTNGQTLTATIISSDSINVMVQGKAGIVMFKRTEIQNITLVVDKASHARLTCAELGLGYGTHISGRLALSLVRERNIFSFHFIYCAGNDPGKPEGTVVYDYGYAIEPRQHLYMPAITYGIYSYGRADPYKVILRAGFSAVFAKVPKYSRIYYLGNEYSYTYESAFAVGLFLNPMIEIPVSTHNGITLGAYGNISTLGIIVGAEAGFAFGQRKGKNGKIASPYNERKYPQPRH